MAAPTKTIRTPLIALASVASAAVSVGTALDVSTLLAGTVFIHFGRRAATALSVPANVRIEASSVASAHGFWFPLATFVSDTVAAADEAVNGTCNAAQAVVPMASTTGFAISDIIFIDNGTIGNSEFGRIKALASNTSVTIEDNLVNAQTGATVYNKAQVVAYQLDLTAITRIRAVVDNTGTGQAIACEVDLITCDTFA